VKILDQQIAIAERLTHDTSVREYSREAKHAWDIVEELSNTLDKVTLRLEHCLCEEREYYAREKTDAELREREYDM
jgi:hypothetical protein